jgi:predicted ABC-type ATPase
MATWKEKYNKKYGYEKSKSNSLSDIAKDTGISKRGLQQIYNKGIGAYKTNPQSVRPNVTSKEQWAMARVYSAVMGGKASKVDAKELKMQMGGKTEKINWSEYYKQGGLTESIMSDEMQQRLFDENGERKNDLESIEVLTDYVNSLPQTKSIYYNESTQKYSPKRQKLHREIINEFKDDLICVESDEPIAILMGGSPASGKSTFLRKYAPYLLSEELLRIDADEVRSKLPEYEGWNASQTHLETKDIVNTLLSDRTIGLPCEFDLIYDGTMNNTKSYLPLIDLLRKLNYKIFVVYIDNVPKDVIVKRALERYKKSGRFVPLEVIDDFFDKGKSALNEIKEKVDGYMIVDGGSNDYRIIEEKGIKLPQNRVYSQLGYSIDEEQFNRNDFYKGYYERLSPSNFEVKQKGGKIQIDLPRMATSHDGIDEVDAIASGVFEKGGETDFNPDGKIKDKIVHASGQAGGMLVGKRHSKGGIKAINKSTGQPLEMEGGEVVITRDAVSDNKKRSFNGKMMTNRQILSAINESGGGVSFADGGQVPNDVQFDCNAEYEYGGKTMCGKDLAYALGGVTNYSKDGNDVIDVFLEKSPNEKYFGDFDDLLVNGKVISKNKFNPYIKDNMVILDSDYDWLAIKKNNTVEIGFGYGSSGLIDDIQYLIQEKAIQNGLDVKVDVLKRLASNNKYYIKNGLIALNPNYALGGVTTAIVTDPNEAMADLQSTYGFGDVYDKGGEVNEAYVDFMNKDKGFKVERKYFKTYRDAEKWARNEFDRFNPDMIGYTEYERPLSSYANGGTTDDEIFDNAREELGEEYLENLDKFAEGGQLSPDEFPAKLDVEETKKQIKEPKIYEETFEMKFLKDKIQNMRKIYNLKKANLSELEKGIELRKIRRFEIKLDELKLEQKSFDDILDSIIDSSLVEFGNMDIERKLTKSKSINGKTSELTKREQEAVKTQSFIDWFGDWQLAYENNNYEGVSKIINPTTKEPLVVYHGTNKKFVSWETYTENNLHYFSKKKEFATWFAEYSSFRGDDAFIKGEGIKKDNFTDGTYVYSCFLDIKNPIDFAPFGVEAVPFNKLLEYVTVKYDIDLSKIKGYENYKNLTTKVYTWRLIRQWQNFNLYIRNNTPFDGFSFYEYIPDSQKRGFEDASLCFTAFNSNQIKFTTNNSFTKQSADSRLEVGGLIF